MQKQKYNFLFQHIWPQNAHLPHCAMYIKNMTYLNSRALWYSHSTSYWSCWCYYCCVFDHLWQESCWNYRVVVTLWSKLLELVHGPLWVEADVHWRVRALHRSFEAPLGLEKHLRHSFADTSLAKPQRPRQAKNMQNQFCTLTHTTECTLDSLIIVQTPY